MYTHSMTYSPETFDATDYEVLHSIVFTPGYPGYRPAVLEAPNGDGKVDADKRYAHIAEKYMAGLDPELFSTQILWDALNGAHSLATKVAVALGIRQEFLPLRSECALRVLEYPAGVGGHEHTDFDLFTLSLYRSEPSKLKLATVSDEAAAAETADLDWLYRLGKVRKTLNPGLHIGELGEIVGLGEATRHHVESSAETQHSIVYFALPSPDVVVAVGSPLCGSAPLTAGTWLAERYARSRVAA